MKNVDPSMPSCPNQDLDQASIDQELGNRRAVVLAAQRAALHQAFDPHVITLVRYCEKEKAFLLYWHKEGWTEATHDQIGSYPIEEDMCSTKAELLKWVVHLLDKNWVTKKHIQQLNQVVGARWSW